METKCPSVLIIILNYRTYDLTIKMIEEINLNLVYKNYSIMVIDNCSPNESGKVLEQKSKEMGFIFYANKMNSGYAAGNNIGICYGIKNGFDYSWILNNDIEFREKSILSDMIQILEENPKIGCIGPKIYTLDGSVCAPYCNRPSLWSMTLGIALDKKYRQRHISTPGYVYRVHGCCMLLRNKVMAEVECMDERTFLYGEELILAERMINKGYLTFYDPRVSVTHKESLTIKRTSKNTKKFQMIEAERSQELYLKEYRHFTKLARWLCHITRKIIIYLQ